MKAIKIVLMTAVVSASAMGCGSKESAKPMPSAEQKAELQAVQASASRAQGAIPTSGSTSPSLSFVQGSIAAAMTGNYQEFFKVVSASTFSNTAGDEARVEMQNKLRDAVDNGDCKVAKTGLDGSSSGSIDPMSSLSGSLAVSGATCPVSFKLTLDSSKSSDVDMSIGFSLEYSVVDASYRGMNDVDSISMNLRFNVSASDSSATITANIDGKMHSQKYGNVTETAKGNGDANRDGGSFEMNVVDSLPGFEVDRGTKFSVNQSGEKSYTYTVNGNEVSKTEFESYGAVEAPVN